MMTKHRKRKYRVRNVVVPMTREQKSRLELAKPKWQSLQGFVIASVIDAVNKGKVPGEVDRLKLSSPGVRSTSVFVELPAEVFMSVASLTGHSRPVDVAEYILGIFDQVLNPLAAATSSPQISWQRR